MEIGPRIKSRETCEGCPALKTEYWKDYLENDETDSGTAATCTAPGGQHIATYWNESHPVPGWCPAKEERRKNVVKDTIGGDDESSPLREGE